MKAINYHSLPNLRVWMWHQVKIIPQQAEVAQGVRGRLRPQIFLTFGTMWEVGRQPYAPAAFSPGEIPGIHSQGLSWPQGTWFHGSHGKKSPVTPSGIDSGTVRLVAQCLNHYATPGPECNMIYTLICYNFKAYSDHSFGVQNEKLQDNSTTSNILQSLVLLNIITVSLIV